MSNLLTVEELKDFEKQQWQLYASSSVAHLYIIYGGYEVVVDNVSTFFMDEHGLSGRGEAIDFFNKNNKNMFLFLPIVR